MINSTHYSSLTLAGRLFGISNCSLWSSLWLMLVSRFGRINGRLLTSEALRPGSLKCSGHFDGRKFIFVDSKHLIKIWLNPMVWFRSHTWAEIFPKKWRLFVLRACRFSSAELTTYNIKTIEKLRLWARLRLVASFSFFFSFKNFPTDESDVRLIRVLNF